MHMSGAFLIVSEQCNFACKYCYEKEHRTKMMEYETFTKTVDLIMKTAKEKGEQASITFFGGEPTVNAKLLCDGLKYILDLKHTDEHFNTPVSVGIITNMGLWNDDIEFFYEKLTGMDNFDIQWSIQMSIDGTPETQNITRVLKGGGPTSKQVFENVLKLEEVFKQRGLTFYDNPRLAVHPVANKDNLPYISEMFDYWADRGVKTMWIMPIHADDYWTDEDATIYGKELIKIKNIALKKNVEYSHFNCLNRGREYGCGAGVSFGGVDAYGNIYPCHHFIFNDKGSNEQYIIGNIFDEDIEKKLDECVKYNYKIKDMKGANGKSCDSCVNRDHCYTCWASNLQEHGDGLECFSDNCSKLYPHEMSARTMYNMQKLESDTGKLGVAIEQLAEVSMMLPEAFKIIRQTTDKVDISAAINKVNEATKYIFDIVQSTIPNTDKCDCNGECSHNGDSCDCGGTCGDECKCKNK